MQVSSMHFKETAHVKLHDARLQVEPRQAQGQVRQRAPATRCPRSTTSRRRARPARRSATARSTTSTSGWRSSSATPPPAARRCCSPRTRADVNALVLEIAARHAVKKIVKVKSMVSEESALDHAIEARGPAGGRDRPRRVHPADQRLRGAVAHRRAGAAQEQGRGRRPVRQGARHAAQDRRRGALPRGPAGAAASTTSPPTWASPAATSSSPRPARWCWSPTRATRRCRPRCRKVHVAISGIEKIVPTLEDVATLTAPAAALGDRPVDHPTTSTSTPGPRARASTTAPSTCTSSSSTAGAPASSAARCARRCAASAAARA